MYEKRKKMRKNKFDAHLNFSLVFSRKSIIIFICSGEHLIFFFLLSLWLIHNIRMFGYIFFWDLLFVHAFSFETLRVQTFSEKKFSAHNTFPFWYLDCWHNLFVKDFTFYELHLTYISCMRCMLNVDSAIAY